MLSDQTDIKNIEISEPRLHCGVQATSDVRFLGCVVTIQGTDILIWHI